MSDGDHRRGFGQRQSEEEEQVPGQVLGQGQGQVRVLGLLRYQWSFDIYQFPFVQLLEPLHKRKFEMKIVNCQMTIDT